MNDTALDSKLREFVGRELNRDVTRLGPNDELTEILGIDSLQGLELLAAVEEEFDVFFPPDSLAVGHSLGAVRNAILKQRAKSASWRTNWRTSS